MIYLIDRHQLRHPYVTSPAQLPLYRSLCRKGTRRGDVLDASKVLKSCGSASWCRRMRGILWSAHCWVQEVSVWWRGLRACNTACATPAETGGSATELSVTDAWRWAAVGDEAYVRLIRTVARSSFRQNARYLTEPRESVSKAIERHHRPARRRTGAGGARS